MRRFQSLRSVLVVEDDDDHAELVEFAILAAEPGIEVARARDGAEAMELLRASTHEAGGSRPGLVFLDLKLPRVDGVGVLRQLKADEAFLSLPAVMLTTSDAAADRARAYAAGANSYLIKPMGFAELQSMIADALRYWGCWNRSAA